MFCSKTFTTFTHHNVYQKKQKFQLNLEAQEEAGETDDVWVDEDVVGELHSTAEEGIILGLGLGLGFWTVLTNGCGAAAATTGA